MMVTDSSFRSIDISKYIYLVLPSFSKILYIISLPYICIIFIDKGHMQFFLPLSIPPTYATNVDIATLGIAQGKKWFQSSISLKATHQITI